MHSELYTAPRQLIGGLSESTGSSGQMRLPRRRECRGTHGVCWGRRGSWRRDEEGSRLRKVSRASKALLANQNRGNAEEERGRER